MRTMDAEARQDAEGGDGGTRIGSHSDTREDEAFVTMVTSDDFVIGAEVMLHSLREHGQGYQGIAATADADDNGQRRPLVVMVTPGVSKTKRQALKAVADDVIEVEPIAMPLQEGVGNVPAWAEVGYTKLRVWGLTQFKRVVYIDADALVMESVAELFDRKVDFAAAPDVFPPDRFNAGVMVLAPSVLVLEDMLSRLVELPTYDGGDTGFLNAYFSDWFARPAAARLPFAYNALRTVYWMTHEKNPGYWNAIGPPKIIHYCSSPKPWEDGKRKGDLEMIWWQQIVKIKMASVPSMRGF